MPRRLLPDEVRAKRELLLESLVELFLAEGFLAFGLGDLAQRLRCSRSTLYVVEPSKDEIVLATLRHYFRRSAARIERRVEAEPDPAARLTVYLRAVARELAPATPAFYADVTAYEPASAVYADNTRHAADRVRELVAAGVADGAMRPVRADFVGAAVSLVMTGIQTGTIGGATGMPDSAAYAALADLVAHGVLLTPGRPGRD